MLIVPVFLPVLDSGTPLKADPTSQVQELGAHVKALVEGTATIRTLQKVVLLCASHPATEADVLPSASEGYLNGGGSGLISPSPSRSNTTGALGHDIWEGGRMFDALLTSLDQFLRTVKVCFHHFPLESLIINKWIWTI